jgi:hypothetical protein
MFIFKWLIKKIFPQKLNDEYQYDPLKSDSQQDDDSEICNHEFMPVDSSGETVACIKCGFIVKLNGNNQAKD